MQFPFDARLAQVLGAVRSTIVAKRQSLYQERRECACDSDGLCVHHAAIGDRLDEAIKQIALAIEYTHKKH